MEVRSCSVYWKLATKLCTTFSSKHTFEIELHQTHKLLNWRRAYRRGGTLLQHGEM